MKVGHKHLYSNGRGNYGPDALIGRQYLKILKKKLDQNPLMDEREKKLRNMEIRSHKHSSGESRQSRKGLNSKLRHMAKKEIKEQINED